MSHQSPVVKIDNVDHATPSLQKESAMVAGAPITHLPQRVLTYIFLLYSASPVSVSFPSHGPFFLAQVCKYWRTTTESNPCLWTFINFSILWGMRDYDEERILQRAKRAFALHLERSVTLPISLTYSDERMRLNSDKLVSFLVDQLQQHSRRWRRISLKFSDTSYFPHLFTTPSDLSSLEHLSILDDGYLGKYCLRLNLKSAKNLKSFEYSGFGELKVDKVDVNWDQLQEVSFQYRKPRDATISSEHLKFLFLCRNMTTCSLGTYATREDIDPQTTPVTLASLRTLNIRLSAWRSGWNRAIDFLILPQLQTLQVDSDSFFCPHSLGNVNDCEISHLLERSKCSLSHLSMQGVNLPRDEILRCLELSSTLLSFAYIPHAQSQDPFWDVMYHLRVFPLAVREQMPIEEHERTQAGLRVLLPELREITVGTAEPAYLETVMVMLRSRGGSRAGAAGVAALRRVRVVVLHVVENVAVPVHLACLRMEMEEWVSEMEKENDGEMVEASVDFMPYPEKRSTD